MVSARLVAPAEWSTRGAIQEIFFDKPETLAALPALLRRSVATIRATKAGSELHLTLDDGSAIVTKPAAQYEAWEVLSPRGGRMVCSPGGDYVAVWPPDES